MFEEPNFDFSKWIEYVIKIDGKLYKVTYEIKSVKLIDGRI